MADLVGYLTFIRTGMGVPTVALPDNSPWIPWTFNFASAMVNESLKAVVGPIPGTWSIYDIAVYNLAGDSLINYAQDVSGQTYFTNLRSTWKINSFVPGVIQATSDEGTSESLLVPDFFKTLTLGDLQNLKTPYGRQYLALAQNFGTLWGLT